MSDPADRETARPGRRRKRLPDDVIRSRMMVAAREMLDIDGGLTVSLHHLSFEEVIQCAAVSRSAAYRLWPSRDSFYDELLLDLAGPEWAGVAAFDWRTIDLANQIIDANTPMLATVEGRLALMVKAAREGSEQNFRAVTSSPQWRTYVALTSTAVSMPPGPVRDQLLEKMRQADQGFLARMSQFYEGVIARIGMRLRPEFEGNYQALAALGAAVVEGLSIRQLVAPEITGRKFPQTIFSSYGPGDWSLASLGFTGVLMTMVEVDPEFEPPTKKFQCD